MFDPHTYEPSADLPHSYLRLATHRRRIPPMYSRVLFILLVAFVIGFHALVLYGLVSCVKGG